MTARAPASHDTCSQMTSGNTTPDDTGRVLPFVQRPSTREGAPVEDVAKYARDGGDDHRQRTINNLLALAVCVLLVLAGVWLVNRLAEIRKNQDCVLSGRPGCTKVPVPERGPRP